MVRQRVAIFWLDQEGASRVEYVVIFALVAVACFLILSAMGLDLGQLYDAALSRLPAGNGVVQPTP